MYKLFKASAFDRREITPEIHAVQFDSARVIPVWIYDLDFSNIAEISYVSMNSAYYSGNPEYKSTYTYYNLVSGSYVEVAFSSLVTGVTYYLKKSAARIAVKKPSGRRVIKDCSFAYNYELMSSPFSTTNPEYKSTETYYKKENDEYIAVAYADLVVGTTYYRKANTVILAPLSEQALAECGTAVGQIQLDLTAEAGGGQISTFKFFLKVEKNFIDHAVSVNEFSSINTLIDKLEKIIEDLPSEEFSAQQMEDVWNGPLPEPNI